MPLIYPLIFFFEPYAEEDSDRDTSCFHFISLAKHLLLSIFWNVLNFLAALRVFAVLRSGRKNKSESSAMLYHVKWQTETKSLK